MKRPKLILVALFAVLLLFDTCKKVEKEMMVTTGSVSNILTTTADVSGNVLDLGVGATQFGHCYSSTSNPTLAGTKTELGVPANGIYTSNLSGLSPSTKYYVKAYIRRGNNVIYGSEINFTTATDVLPTLNTTIITSVTKTSAVSGGTISDQGGTPVTARGVCWSLTSPPTISNYKTNNGTGIDSYISNLTGLAQGTTYYIRAYATNSGGTAYGNELSFITYDITPTLTTVIPSSITATEAVCGGNITFNGDASVTTRGVCWSTSHNPSLSDSWVASGSGIGNYSCNISGLAFGTTYYVRAYATNNYGTGYGNEVTFTTLLPPGALTSSASFITTSGAILNGSVNAKNSSTTTTFEYGLSTAYGNSVNADQSPVTGNSWTSVSTTLIGLTPGQTYHYRVKAVSSNGTTYGSDIPFSTIPGTVNDFDGNIYNLVSIGSQVWFAENLRTKHYRNGILVNSYISYKEQIINLNSNLQVIISAGGGSFTLSQAVSAGYLTALQKASIENALIVLGISNFNNMTLAQISAALTQISSKLTDAYGLLYPWSEVSDARGVCPTGWHIPTDAELTTLSISLGGENVAGGKLKETGTTNWTSPNKDATNLSGFTGIPGGKLMNNTFSSFFTDAYFWSASESNSSASWVRNLNFNTAQLTRTSEDKTIFFSIRCIMNGK
jgi:uncharacterized protein (TIGR02145 family)